MTTLRLVPVLALCLAGAASAQARSERVISVGKEHTPAKPPRVDTVQVIVHDTVLVQHTDTLSVFRTATLQPAAPVDADSAKCSDRYIPIPIPFPLPRGHDGGSGEGSSIATTATPEPGTMLTVGTGLALFVGYLRWRR